MSDLTITIPSPTLSGSASFTVVVKDSSGATVFSGTETNAPFLVTGLSAGDYKMYVTYEGETTVECFTIPAACICASITASFVSHNAIQYLHIDFDFTGTSFPSCGIDLVVDFPDGTNVSYHINSLSDFTHDTGDTYFIEYLCAAETVTVNVTADCCNRTQTKCGAYTVTNKDCVAPQVFSQSSGADGFSTCHKCFELFTDGSGNYFMAISVNDAGVTCHTLSVTYTQNYVNSGTPDSGSFTMTIDPSSSFPFSYYSPALSPNMDFTNPHEPGTLSYHTVITDCCGKVVSDGDTIN